MKVLIVDDEVTTRRVLTVLLERAGYTTVTAEDGQRALEAALTPDPPHIILLDWVLPLLEGPEVCARIRAAAPKIRPYIIMLSAKQTKAEVAAGLDAGADDFVSKPFSPDEMNARLRVARRTVTYQLELHRRIAEIEHLKQSNKLLGEIISTNASDQAPPPARPDATATPLPPRPTDPATPEAPALPTWELAAATVADATSRALGELGLAAVSVEPRKGRTAPSAVCGWTGLLTTTTSRWIDVLLEGADAQARLFFEQALRRPPADRAEVLHFLAEASRAVGQAFASALEPGNGPTVAPLLPRTLTPASLGTPPPWHGDHPCYRVTCGAASLDLTVVSQLCPAQPLSPESLHENDILHAQYPPPTLEEVPMLMAGTVLTPRFIDKISGHYESREGTGGIPVHRPSRTALLVHAAH